MLCPCNMPYIKRTEHLYNFTIDKKLILLIHEYKNKPHDRVYTDYCYSHITQKVFKSLLMMHHFKNVV